MKVGGALEGDPPQRVPQSLKVKLDNMQARGVTASGFIRGLLKREFKTASRGQSSKEPLSQAGSAKKLFQRQDVLISRLRPYLRQVAFADDDLTEKGSYVTLACSTEFFVLRSNSTESIAFLVLFLLSSPVQKVLAASQEGGHHPRFDEEVLLTLPIPQALLAERANYSSEVIRAIDLYRQSERILAHKIKVSEMAIVPKQ